MSFWDRLKPAEKSPSATKIVLSNDGRHVEIDWSDGVKSTLYARHLRQSCPCAECVEEWSGKRTFEIETIPVDMKILEVQPVGSYALSFTFGDSHRTGIFQWSMLRSLG